VVVDDLHVESIGPSPHEADAPLVVDADTVLALPFALQLLETIAWRNAKVLNRSRAVHQQELSPGRAFECTVAKDLPVVKKVLHRPRPKGPDHPVSISFNGKRYNYAHNTPAAFRVFWYYGPEKGQITILAITGHP
jgi:hypothetical protein